MNILYSFNKRGDEAVYWEREIAAASTEKYRFFPFNHGNYLDSKHYSRAQLLDNLYYENDHRLMTLYNAFEDAIAEHKVDAVVVDNKFPYHPDYLRKIPVYKALRTTDGPMAAYDRDFAYLHAYDLVLYHTPAYSRDMDIEAKLTYLGAKDMAFWPLGLFDRMHDTTKDESIIMDHERDIDVVFVGATHLNKMPLITRVKKALGKRCAIYGLSTWKRNLYIAWKYKYPYWTTPIGIDDYSRLYQRAKIGFNVHNRGKYTLGGYRLFDLPGNGVMQISDGDEYLGYFFDVGDEIISYSKPDDLIEKIRFYLENDSERQRIALNGFKRVMRDYKMNHLFGRLYELLSERVYVREH